VIYGDAVRRRDNQATAQLTCRLLSEQHCWKLERYRTTDEMTDENCGNMRPSAHHFMTCAPARTPTSKGRRFVYQTQLIAIRVLEVPHGVVPQGPQRPMISWVKTGPVAAIVSCTTGT